MEYQRQLVARDFMQTYTDGDSAALLALLTDEVPVPSGPQRLRRVPARRRTVSAVAWFRGAVALAAVPAVPHRLDSGARSRAET